MTVAVSKAVEQKTVPVIFASTDLPPVTKVAVPSST